MSKNTTKKGLALGAGIALVASAFVAAPASADTTGPITLVPSAGGTTFNSILQSGITLSSEIDPLTSAEDAGSLAFLIENPGAATIGATFDTAGSLAKALTFQTDTSPATTAFTNMANANRLSDINAGRLTSNAISSANEFVYLTGYSDEADATPTFAEAAVGTAGAEVQDFDEVTVVYGTAGTFALTLPNGDVLSGVTDTTVAASELQTAIRADTDYDAAYTVIGVVAGSDTDNSNSNLTFDITVTFQVNGNQAASTLKIDNVNSVTVDETTQGKLGTGIAGYNFGRTSAANTLAISTTEATKNVTLYVTAWLDANGNGIVDAFEASSDRETITLYAPSNVSATTEITTLARSASKVDGTSNKVQATVVYSNDINPYAVESATKISLFKDGVLQTLNSDGTTYNSGNNVTKSLAASTASTPTTGKLTATAYGQTTAGTAGLDFVAGVYSASAYFYNGTSDIAVGAASAVVDLNNGLVASITSTDAYMTETANVDFASDVAAIRTGTNAVTVVAKSNIADKAGQKFRATVTATAIDATSTVAVSGSASTLAATDDVVVAYATSDSTGKVSFTLTNSGAVKADNIDVDISTLTAAGTYTTADNVDITWADAALTSFSAVPGNYISGANPTLTYKAKDQFGQPVSKTATGALSVTVVAKIGGIEKKLLLSDTKSMVDGSVAFTFANFATASIPGQVQATLFEGVTQSSVGASGVIVANVYNTSDTATITVLDSYATTITYKDFVVGDATDATVAAAVTLTGISGVTGSTISGSVQNASAVGQPGAEVTVAADGILFYDVAQGIYAEDSIVIYTNEYGAYSVKAIAHMINTAGHAVTITTGGKTASTLLKAYLPVDELTAGNLALSWDLPAELVMNTTYALTVTLTDKWGNPVATPSANSVAIEGNGSVLVNGVTGATSKKFDKNGQTTVFVRSIKDIAGPGAVSAALIDLSTSQYAIDPAVTGAGSVAGFDDFGSLVALTTDATSTVWDETAFASALSAVVDVKETASAVVAGGLKAGEVVNVGTFNNKIVVYAKGMKGETITWKIAGKWVKVEVTKDYQLFDRLTAAIGVNVNVDVYRATVKTPLLSKTVLTK